MVAFTINQWAILLLVLVLGWLLGLMSKSGGGKWRRAYEVERSDGIRLRADMDARMAAANARIAELERTPTAMTATPVAVTADHDDLGRIRGIGRSGESQLHDLGIRRYTDITRMSAAEEAALEGRMGAEPGYIARERWREQAEMLAAGRTDEHRGVFG